MDSVCQRCGAENETINHILFECPSAVQCWALSTIPSAPEFFPCSSIYVNFDILLQVISATNMPASVSSAPWLIWYLWKARNDRFFNNKDTDPMDTMQLAGHEAETWKIAQVRSDDHMEQQSNQGVNEEAVVQGGGERWVCQFDASWTEQDPGAGIGFIRYDGGTVAMRGHRNCGYTPSPPHAEAESPIWAMEEISRRGFLQVNFKSDCQQLVQVIGMSKKWPALNPETDVIESLKSIFLSFTLSFISRSLNFRADSLAKEVRSRDLNFSVVDVLVAAPLALEASTSGPV